MNKKYDFLSDATAVVDLCAAPGSWLQVLTQICPKDAKLIGVDLVKIKAIPRCQTFVQDITKPSCLTILKRALEGQKADVVLHDGAPCVGANWSKDAFNQSELCLSALKLATGILREGGTFVSKVFRSGDFHSLIWLFEKLFKSVRVAKPLASRFSSAEIFVVCQAYNNPDFIDQKLFDTKYVFQNNEADIYTQATQAAPQSIKDLLMQTKNRQGYDDSMPMHMHRVLNFSDLLTAENPYEALSKANEIKITDEEVEQWQKLKPPANFQAYFADLKVLGKSEISAIIKWRNRILTFQNKASASARKQDEVKETKEDQNAIELQLDNEILDVQHEVMKDQRKQKKMEEKQLKRLLKVQPQINLPTEDEIFRLEDHAMLAHSQIDLDPEADENNEQNNRKRKHEAMKKSQRQQELEEDIEQAYEDKKLRRQQAHEKQKTESKPLTRTNLSTDVPIRAKEKRKLAKQEHANEFEAFLQQGGTGQSHWYDRKIFESLDVPQDETGMDSVIKSNSKPASGSVNTANQQIQVGKKRNQSNDAPPQPEDDLWNDDAYKLEVPMTEMEKRRLNLSKGKNVSRDKKSLTKDTSTFQVVPMSDPLLKKNNHSKSDSESDEPKLEDYDVDALAETRALAKKMLRRRTREAILDQSYNRHAIEGEENLPKWFIEDEQKHVYKHQLVTKEEIKAEKEHLLAISARAPKKVLEAKLRRAKRQHRQLMSVKAKAQTIMDQDGLSEALKMRQVQKLQARQQALGKEEKKYVVTHRFQGKGGKGSRTVRFVDRRLKKDKRGQKHKTGISKKGISKKRQIHRHKGRKARN